MKKLLIGLFTFVSINVFADSIDSLLKVKDCTITVKEDIFFERGERASTIRKELSGFSMEIKVSAENLTSRRRLAKDREITITTHDFRNCIAAQDNRVESICVTNLVNPLAEVSPKQFNNLANNKLEISCKDEGQIVDI